MHEGLKRVSTLPATKIRQEIVIFPRDIVLGYYTGCYHSMQNLLSSRLLSKILKIKIYRTIILTVVLYGCETWSLTLREKRRLGVFANRVE
jgi:hypothetical protein